MVTAQKRRCGVPKIDGTPCRKWAMTGSERCGKHLDLPAEFRLATLPNDAPAWSSSRHESLIVSAEQAVRLNWYVEFLGHLKALVDESGNRLPLLDGEFTADEPTLTIQGRTLPVAALAVFLPDGELEVTIGKGVLDKLLPVLTPLEVRDGAGRPTICMVCDGMAPLGEQPYIAFAPFRGQMFVSAHPDLPVRDDGMPDLKALRLGPSEWLVPPAAEEPERRSNPDLSFARLNAAMAAGYLPFKAKRRPPLPAEDPEGAAMHIPLLDICKRAKVTESEALEALESTTAWGWRVPTVNGDCVFGDPEPYLCFYPHSGWEKTLPLMAKLLELSGPGDRAAACFARGTVLSTNWQPERLTLTEAAKLCGLEGHFRHDHACRINPTIGKAFDRLRQIGILKSWEFGANSVLLEWEPRRQMLTPARAWRRRNRASRDRWGGYERW
jgi:hypothetical protein